MPRPPCVKGAVERSETGGLSIPGQPLRQRFALPPMAEFLQICNYFDITPSQFFDESEENPALLQTAIEELRKLNYDDLMLIIGNIRRLTRE